ncbi:hypothetical protein EIN_344380 [Entamoeba invadens IP1]|uniref:AAA+ ATPase domain-containing protein n=1 Tax=Entamoeba invadens IP1 TaxID=370355 RepID=A0A0A1U946_ENTIV|nr:hypothetical protein EIN_344380 [Entamoeba invadens IP1]ELP88498.1 hypothetical protein EIN_344380 [Entamoeba invadens IP1]|eukprot:XP_004255269.1 hypothetical protein EIN_344380 [Entamoeba invadens IP1]
MTQSPPVMSLFHNLVVSENITDVQFASLLDQVDSSKDPHKREYISFLHSSFLQCVKPYDISTLLRDPEYVKAATCGAALFSVPKKEDTKEVQRPLLQKREPVSVNPPVSRKVVIDEEVPKSTDIPAFVTASDKLTADNLKKGIKPKRKFQPPYKKDDKDEKDQKQKPLPKEKKSGEEDIISDVNGVPLDDPRLVNSDPLLLTRIVHEILDSSPKVTWDDIAGLTQAKKIVQEAVIWPMLRPDIFTGLRAPPKGILLFGPPGTGKTLIGKAVASESDATFFNISASALTSKWIGEGEKMVRALFAVASCYVRSVIFIDEIDSLLSARSETEHESSRRLKTEFLVRLDGAGTTTDERILVVGATNRPQEIDEAARRRLVKRLYIPLPDLEARNVLVKTLLKKVNNKMTDEEISKIGNLTDGYSGSDMKELVRDAAFGPIRELNSNNLNIIDVKTSEVRPVEVKDFLESLKSIRPSVSQDDLLLYVDWNNKFGSVNSQ